MLKTLGSPRSGVTLLEVQNVNMTGVDFVKETSEHCFPVSLLQNQHTDAVSEQLPTDLQGLCDDLETKLTVVTEKITSLQ